MIVLFPISWRMWQWKNFENRPVFDEVSSYIYVQSICELLVDPPCILQILQNKTKTELHGWRRRDATVELSRVDGVNAVVVSYCEFNAHRATSQNSDATQSTVASRRRRRCVLGFTQLYRLRISSIAREKSETVSVKFRKTKHKWKATAKYKKQQLKYARKSRHVKNRQCQYNSCCTQIFLRCPAKLQMKICSCLLTCTV